MRTLVATDLTPEADALVDRAAAWAHRTGAELHIRAVSGLLRGASILGGAAETRFMAREWQRLRSWEWERIEALLEGIAPDHRGTARILQGATWKSLVQVSAAFDLLIVGAADRDGLARLLLGSISEAVAFKAHCPVLVLPDETDPVEAASGPLRVLCPVNVDAPRLGVARWIGRHVEKPLQYELAHALTHAPDLVRRGTDSGPVVRRHPDADRARARLDDLAASGALDTSRSHVVMAHDDGAASAVLLLADSVGAHLIALTTDSQPWVARKLTGSVTEAILRSAPCPVLVAHDTELGRLAG